VAALHLARGGRQVTVFEAQEPGYGASTRNAGYVGRTLKHGFGELVEHHGLPFATQIYGELMEAFLAASRTRRLYMVVHQTEHITRHCPRMLALLARFAHAIQINRTHEEIRSLQDSFLVLDSQHYVRRPAAAFYRGAIGLGDETEAQAMRHRFMEIWEASFPGVAPTTVGL